jgi:hypothetical protein
MIEKVHKIRFWLGLAIPLLLICGCGNRPQDAKTADSPAAPLESDHSGTSNRIRPCELLTAEQVATVLPNHDGGMAVLSGGSLMKGVDAYQCSYSNKTMDLMTVVLNIADNDDNFSWIKPSEGLHRDDRKVEIADGGWVYGEDDDLKIEVVKGRTIIDLELMAPGARSKAEALIELARVVAGNIR